MKATTRRWVLVTCASVQVIAVSSSVAHSASGADTQPTSVSWFGALTDWISSVLHPGEGASGTEQDEMGDDSLNGPDHGEEESNN